MRNRGVRGGRADPDRHADEAAAERAGGAVPSPVDRLDYIAQLVGELKVMAADANEPALAVLLELAYQEAVRKRRAG